MAFDRVGRIRFGSDLNAEDMGAEYGLDLNSAYQINSHLPKAPTKCRTVSTFHTHYTTAVAVHMHSSYTSLNFHSFGTSALRSVAPDSGAS
ncbi:unnamed protein product [Anisakis simplex]|uniref:Uncharacterized protein n=1 Tax=Anisakis simplex TaxID=6269 RepID=A0A0M3JPZ7_ANISI|nr:unnamed protein product [Anisakis simplex]